MKLPWWFGNRDVNKCTWHQNKKATHIVNMGEDDDTNLPACDSCANEARIAKMYTHPNATIERIK